MKIDLTGKGRFDLGDSMTFQAILELNTGNESGAVIFNYVDLDTDDSPNGVRASVGVKNTGKLDPVRLVISEDRSVDPVVGSGRAFIIERNHAPEVAPLGPVPVDEGGSVTITAIATDADDDVLTYAWDLDNDGTFDAIGTSPSVTFSATSLNGPTSATVRLLVTDGRINHDVLRQVRIEVNNAPPTAGNDSLSATEDSALTFAAADLLSNDSDPGHDALTLAVLSQPANGTLDVNADGSFTYTPSSNYFGPDEFTYRLTDADGAVSGVATVRIDVAAVNDEPVAGDDSAMTDEDTAVTLDLLANASDVDGDALSAEILSGPSHGRLSLNEDGSFTYTPDANYHGPDGFTYRVSDGSLSSAAATVSLTVTAVNDAPVSAADHYETNEDTALTVDAPGVLANDTDAEGGALSAVLVQGPEHGSLTLNADGSFSYTPAANFHGTDGFTYRADDGSGTGNVATVVIDVASVNDAPVGVADAVNTDEDVAVHGNVLANDTDVEDGRPATAQLVAEPVRGTVTLNPDGSFTYVPGANYFGTDSFAYRAVDADGGTSMATVTIRIAEVNDAPVAANDAATTANDADLHGAVLPNDSDPDNEDGLAGNDDTLTAELVSGTAHGTLSLESDGRFTYRANAGFTGTDTFTYRVRDSRDLAGAALATVTITVTPSAEPPPPPAGIQLIPDVTQPGKMALLIHGTAAGELIAVTPATGGVEVYLGANSQGVFNPTGRIIIYGGGGNDAILIAGSVSKQVWAYGDEGNDVIKLGSGGGIAFGGAGSDAIVGGTGRDVIVGGENGDLLVGNPGDDILISAMTVYDDRSIVAAHEDAWAKMYAEWASGRTFGERVNNLKGCTTSGLNGSYLLSTARLVDDQAADSIDILCGSSGTDWLIYKLGEDLAVGMSSTEAAVDGGIA